MIDENTDNSAEIWFTPDRQHFYAIPADSALPAGALLIQKVGGKKHATTLDAVVDLEISREDAESQIRAKIDGAWGGLQGAFGKLLSFGREAAAKTGVELDEAEIRPLPDLTTILGFSPAEIYTEPEKARGRARDTLARVFRPLSASADAANSETETGESAASSEDREEAKKSPPDPEQILLDVSAKFQDALTDPRLTQAMASLGAGLSAFGQRLREQKTQAAQAAQADGPKEEDEA